MIQPQRDWMDNYTGGGRKGSSRGQADKSRISLLKESSNSSLQWEVSNAHTLQLPSEIFLIRKMDTKADLEAHTYNAYTIQRFENKLDSKLLSSLLADVARKSKAHDQLNDALRQRTGMRSYFDLVERKERNAESEDPPIAPTTQSTTLTTPSGVDTPSTPSMDLMASINLELESSDDLFDDLTLRLTDMVVQLKGAVVEEPCNTAPPSNVQTVSASSEQVSVVEGDRGSYGAWILSPEDFKRRMSAARSLSDMSSSRE
jgi:hypothetical protein